MSYHLRPQTRSSDEPTVEQQQADQRMTGGATTRRSAHDMPLKQLTFRNMEHPRVKKYMPHVITKARNLSLDNFVLKTVPTVCMQNGIKTQLIRPFNYGAMKWC